MSSWQVLQVSVPTYKVGSTARTYFCATTSCLAFDLPALLVALLGLSSATAKSVASNDATMQSPGRSRRTRGFREPIGAPSPDQLSYVQPRPAAIFNSRRIGVGDGRHMLL